MQSEAKVIIEVEIDFDVVPDREMVTAVLLDMDDLSLDFKKRVAEGKFVYGMVNK